MWAIGVVAFFMLSGNPPFEFPNEKAQLDTILNADFNFSPPYIWNKISAQGTNSM